MIWEQKKTTLLFAARGKNTDLNGLEKKKRNISC